VLSKEFVVASDLFLKSSLGYGVPFVFGGTSRGGFFQEKQSEFLTGLFGGIEFVYLQNSSLSMEYDGRAINIGLTHLLFDKISLDVFFQGISQIGFGLNYTGAIN